MVNDYPVLIPPTSIVREQLARSIRETDLLRSLLRLSVKADAELGSARVLAYPNRQPQAGQAVRP